jgi:threonine aldolase
VLVGSAELVAQARVWRKRYGGGMRQVGVLAAAGLHALDHHLDRMAEDHEHARLIAEACGVDPATVPTNIVVVDVPSAPEVVAAADAQGVRIGAVGPHRVRLLTHLDVTREDAEQAAKVLASLLSR